MNLQNAESILREKGKTFYWASYLLDRKQAAQAAQMYAICRKVDDIVDEAHSRTAASQELGAFKESVLRSDFFKEAEVSREAFIDLTEGVLSDLGAVEVQDEKELLNYCYQVAGTVGLMMCNVLGVRDQRAMKHAVDLGIAMQITNICRDVATDAHLGRRYLPLTLVGDLSLTDLVSPPLEKQPVLRSALSTLLGTADRYYESGLRGIVYLPLRARIAILVAAALYRQIGIKLTKRRFDYWSFRAQVSPLEKAFMTVKILFQFFTTSQYWRLPRINASENAS